MAKRENENTTGIVNRGGTNSYENTAHGPGARVVNGKVVKGDQLPDTKDKKK